MRLARVLIALVLLVAFLALSAVLARAFSAGGAERDVAREIVHAEARGDVAAVLAHTTGCRGVPACEQRIAATVARVRRPGDVEILNVAGDARLAAGAGTHPVRVAWRAGGSLPTVQCITVRRSGDLVRGFDVGALAIRTIARDADC